MWGGGTLLLAAVLAWAYGAYRRGGPGPEDREKVARQNVAARAERSPDDQWPPVRRDVRPLIMMACAVVSAAVIVLGLTWFNRSPTFGADRAPVAERK